MTYRPDITHLPYLGRFLDLYVEHLDDDGLVHLEVDAMPLSFNEARSLNPAKIERFIVEFPDGNYDLLRWSGTADFCLQQLRDRYFFKQVEAKLRDEAE